MLDYKMLPRDFRAWMLRFQAPTEPRACLIFGASYGPPPGGPIVLESPALFVPDGSRGGYVEALASDGQHPFIDALLAIDNAFLQTLSERSSEWLGVSCDRAQLRVILKPLVRIATGEPPMVRMKTSADLSIPARSWVRCLVQVSCGWVNETGIGVSLRLRKHQIVGKAEPAFEFLPEDD